MVSKNRLEYLIDVCTCDNENGMKLCQSSLNEINSVLKEINEKYEDIFPKPIGQSFLDDEEKMIDFYVLSENEFLNFYSYLTKEDYGATIHDIIKRIGYWHEDWHEDNPDMDGRNLKDIVFGIMTTRWLMSKGE